MPSVPLSDLKLEHKENLFFSLCNIEDIIQTTLQYVLDKTVFCVLDWACTTIFTVITVATTDNNRELLDVHEHFLD